MDIEKDSNREAFEAWFESRYDANFMQFALDLDMYVDKHTQTCWEAWQAAKAQAVPDGFVVVPKKATKKMLDAGYEAHDGFFSNGAVQDVYIAMIEASQEQAND